MGDILFMSNGNGEDAIACRLIDSMRVEAPDLTIHAWPMVGQGAAYAQRSVPLVGALNELPSAGFATLSGKMMIDDLRAGWISTHWRQYRAARALRDGYTMAVAVGDIIPILAGILSRLPFAFVGCAKSAYYRGSFYRYTALEKFLLKRWCKLVFPRDTLTERELRAAGVEARYLGNPMMDGLTGIGDRLGTSPDDIVVAMLAGTRGDAETNLLDLIAMIGDMPRHHATPRRLRFIFAARRELDVAETVARIAADQRLVQWRAADIAPASEGVVLRLNGPENMQVLVAKDRFADILHLSAAAIGMAGTANEQAVGLGVPLVAVPSRGVQGERFVRMKAEYFGEAAVTVAREAQAVSAALGGLLADSGQRARMAAAGRERMGEAGASRAIAAELLKMLGR